jgi:paraquat-inducible protein B
MKKELNPKILGAFVLIAIALLIFTVILFGANQLFRVRHPYVMFFESSLNGLQEGSPIKFRGITVGRVTHIKVVLDHKSRELFMPVYVELTPDSITEINVNTKLRQHDLMEEMIQQGLRARLALQNMLTGMLYIELDFNPKVPFHLTHKDKTHMEIPTIQSKTEELSSMLSTGQSALESIREFMKSLQDQSRADMRQKRSRV